MRLKDASAYNIQFDGVRPVFIDLLSLRPYREGEFWDAVLSRTPPSFLPPVAPPVPPEKWRTVSMDGNNLWAAMAGDWLEHRDGAKRFAAAEKEIKGLMEADIGVASGHGIVCKRSKNGALRISEEK